MLSLPAASALNHLLEQSGWALQRLMPFSGRTARFNLPPFSFACTIQPDGALRPASRDSSADAVCNVAPSLLPRLALHDESALELIECSGDAALIDEIFFLARNLRWDAAEDLSRFTGDIAAERIVQLTQAAQKQAGKTFSSLSQALAEYWTEERPLISTPRQLAQFEQGVGNLLDSVEQLESRILQLSKAK